MTGAPGDDVPDAMRTEFDTVASWTSEAVAELGQDFAVVAGCRGSGSPAGLAWLCESLRLEPGARLLDAGAGVGGPAAYAAEHYGAQPVLTEPMVGACAAARSLFGFPTVAAWRQLSFADPSFEVTRYGSRQRRTSPSSSRWVACRSPTRSLGRWHGSPAQAVAR